MRKNFMFLLMVLLLVSSALFAGGEQEQQAEKAEDEVVTVDFMITTVTQDPEGPMTEKIIEAFEKEYPNIKINTIGVPMNQALTKITTLATAGELPDLFVNTEGFYGQLHDMGITADLSEVMSDADMSRIIPSIKDACTLDGELVLWPWYTVPQAILYRADWVEELGLEAPQTWDELLEVAQAMTSDTDGDGAVDRWGFGLVGTNDGSGQGRFLQILRSFGAKELYEENGEWKTDIGSPESIAAFKFFAEMKTKYEVAPPGALENSFNQNVNLMAHDQVGLFLTGPHTTGKIFAQNPELNGKLYSVPVPLGETRVTPLSLYGVSMNPDSDVKEEAAIFLNYLTSTENMLEWTKVTGRLPCFSEPSEADFISGPMFQGFLDSNEYLVKLPIAAFYSEVKNIMGQAYQTLMVDPTADPAEVVKKAGKEIQAVIDRES